MAVHHANVMAERMWHQYNGRDAARLFGVCNVGAYRRRIEEIECGDFGIIRDVDDGFKHVQLTRTSRRVTSADQTGAAKLDWTNAAEEKITWNNAEGEELNWSAAIIVSLDDGTVRPLLPMLRDVVTMWDKLSA